MVKETEENKYVVNNNVQTENKPNRRLDLRGWLKILFMRFGQHIVHHVLTIERILAIGASIGVLLLMFLVFADVGLRFLFNRPIPGSIEIGITVLVYIIILPLAYTEAQNKHIRVDFIMQHFNPVQRAIFDLFVYSVGALIFALFTWQAWGFFYDSWLVNELMGSSQLRLPFYISKFALPLGGLLLTMQFLINAARQIRRFKKGES